MPDNLGLFIMLQLDKRIDGLPCRQRRNKLPDCNRLVRGQNSPDILQDRAIPAIGLSGVIPVKPALGSLVAVDCKRNQAGIALDL